MPRIVYAKGLWDQIQVLPLPIKIRVLRLIERLKDWPAVSGAKPLRGKLAGHFRLRTGDYRLQFCVVDNEIAIEKEIVIEKVGHRSRYYGD
jgi:mRNA-degrading endonuclease RelE of RelBE toxin-antitoxin system